jgi:hypothetical protein
MVMPGSTTPASRGSNGKAEVAIGDMNDLFLEGVMV